MPKTAVKTSKDTYKSAAELGTPSTLITRVLEASPATAVGTLVRVLE